MQAIQVGWKASGWSIKIAGENRVDIVQWVGSDLVLSVAARKNNLGKRNDQVMLAG